MRWIGLTGSIGTGKSTVAEFLRDFGYHVVDADQLAKKQLLKNTNSYKEIVKIFGTEILSSRDEIDNRKLADVVFKNPNDLKRLESIIHPNVKHDVEHFKQKIETEGALLGFYDVPLLFEKKLKDDFDKVILVSCNLENQIQRLKSRNHWTDVEIERRLKNQMSLNEKKPLSDYVIENDGTMDELKNKTREILDLIINMDNMDDV